MRQFRSFHHSIGCSLALTLALAAAPASAQNPESDDTAPVDSAPVDTAVDRTSRAPTPEASQAAPSRNRFGLMMSELIRSAEQDQRQAASAKATQAHAALADDATALQDAATPARVPAPAPPSDPARHDQAVVQTVPDGSR